MSTGDGGDDRERRPGADGERHPIPPPRSRTPRPRTSQRSEGGVEHVPASIEKRATGSVFSRMFGRRGLDEALEERFQPYEYQSTRPILRWLFLGLIVFIAAGGFAIAADSALRGQVNEWHDQGLTEIPIGPEDVGQATLVADLELQDPDVLLCNEEELASSSVIAQGCRSIDRVIEYAVAQGFQCTSLEEMASVVSTTRVPVEGCDRLVEVTTRFDDLESRSNIASIFIVVMLIVVAFPFSSFIHRSSRNLRTLKSEGQKHSPDGTVIRFFVPVLNMYKPLIMIVELFKGSDPRIAQGDIEQWKKRGNVSPIAVLWAIAWGASAVFNPITVSRLFYRDQPDMAAVGSAATGLLIADILVVVLGVLAILMANTLSRWQDLRAAKYGTVTVIPPRPRDPLEKALEEGVRRNEENTTSTGDRSRRRRNR